MTQNKKGAFHPSGDWLAVANHESLTLWATGQTQSFVLRGHQSVAWHVYFTNDSKWLISCGQYDGVRTWPLNSGFGVAGSIGPRAPAMVLQSLRMEESSLGRAPGVSALFHHREM